MLGPREVLNRLKWLEGSLGRARITIVHRGAPGDQRVISGSDIVSLGKGFVTVRGAEGEIEIPYHRVLRVEVDGRTVWNRTTVRRKNRL
jgi:uncharacterized protein (UPF0248 family)